MNNDVVDLFQEELDKKQFKEEKKIAKKVAKEKKREKKKLKKLEKIEDEEFAKKLEEKNDEEDIVIKKENVIENILKEKTTRSEKVIPVEKKHTFLNIILTISIIILLIASGDYAIYNIVKEKELEIIITSSSLCLLSIFYILSIIVNKPGLKKFFQILATLSIAAYMCYQLFMI